MHEMSMVIREADEIHNESISCVWYSASVVYNVCTCMAALWIQLYNTWQLHRVQQDLFERLFLHKCLYSSDQYTLYYEPTSMLLSSTRSVAMGGMFCIISHRKMAAKCASLYFMLYLYPKLRLYHCNCYILNISKGSEFWSRFGICSISYMETSHVPSFG